MLASWKKSYDKPRQHIKKQRHYCYHLSHPYHPHATNSYPQSMSACYFFKSYLQPINLLSTRVHCFRIENVLPSVRLLTLFSTILINSFNHTFDDLCTKRMGTSGVSGLETAQSRGGYGRLPRLPPS